MLTDFLSSKYARYEMRPHNGLAQIAQKSECIGVDIVNKMFAHEHKHAGHTHDTLLSQPL
jgi:hypothetical protein